MIKAAVQDQFLDELNSTKLFEMAYERREAKQRVRDLSPAII
jgi:hypothetical protein